MSLAQINTGEGKGIVTALLATMNWVEGNTVDVCTSNDQLAKRDLKEFIPYYQALDIPVADGCLLPNSEQTAYKRDGINYAAVSDLALFRSHHEVQGTWKKPKHTALIQDEVDATRFDDESAYRLAKNLSLIPVKQEVWQWLYESIYDFVCSDELFTKKYCSSRDDIVNLKRYLVDKADGDKVKESIVNASTDDKIDMWIKSACRVKFFKENKKYKLLPENPNDINSPKAVRILDEQTKAVKGRSSWSDGVHQLATAKINKELREKGEDLIKINPEVDVISSMVSKNFIDYYEKVNGITGTLGNEEECYDLRMNFGFSLTKMPPHNKNNRKNHAAKICKNRDDVHNNVKKTIKQQGKNLDRPILVICDDIDSVHAMYQKLKVDFPDAQIQTYDGSRIVPVVGKPIEFANDKERKAFTKNAGNANVITIATPIFARGTDIKIDLGKTPKGLCVINTALKDVRLVWQILGRAGRRSDPGDTYQLYDENEVAKYSKPSFFTRTEKRLQDAFDKIEEKETRARRFREVQYEMRKVLQQQFLQLNNAIPDPVLQKSFLELWVSFYKKIDLMWVHAKNKNKLFEQKTHGDFDKVFDDIVLQLSHDIAEQWNNTVLNVMQCEIKKNSYVILDETSAIINCAGNATITQKELKLAAHTKKHASICYDELYDLSLANQVSWNESLLDTAYLNNTIGITGLDCDTKELSKSAEEIIKNTIRTLHAFPEFKKLQYNNNLPEILEKILNEILHAMTEKSYPFARPKLEKAYHTIMNAVRGSRNQDFQVKVQEFHEKYLNEKMNPECHTSNEFLQFVKMNKLKFEDEGFYSNITNNIDNNKNDNEKNDLKIEGNVIEENEKDDLIEEKNIIEPVNDPNWDHLLEYIYAKISIYENAWGHKAQDRLDNLKDFQESISKDKNKKDYISLITAINTALANTIESDRTANDKLFRVKRNIFGSRYVKMLEAIRDRVIATAPKDTVDLLMASAQIGISPIISDLSFRLKKYSDMTKFQDFLNAIKLDERPQDLYRQILHLRAGLIHFEKSVKELDKRDVTELFDLLAKRCVRLETELQLGTNTKQMIKDDETIVNRVLYSTLTQPVKISDQAKQHLMITNSVHVDVAKNKETYTKLALGFYKKMLLQYQLTASDKLTVHLETDRDDKNMLTAHISFANGEQKLIKVAIHNKLFQWEKPIFPKPEPQKENNSVEIIHYDHILTDFGDLTQKQLVRAIIQLPEEQRKTALENVELKNKLFNKADESDMKLLKDLNIINTSFDNHSSPRLKRPIKKYSNNNNSSEFQNSPSFLRPTKKSSQNI